MESHTARVHRGDSHGWEFACRQTDGCLVASGSVVAIGYVAVHSGLFGPFRALIKAFSTPNKAFVRLIMAYGTLRSIKLPIIQSNEPKMATKECHLTEVTKPQLQRLTKWRLQCERNGLKFAKPLKHVFAVLMTVSIQFKRMVALFSARVWAFLIVRPTFWNPDMSSWLYM